MHANKQSLYSVESAIMKGLENADSYANGKQRRGTDFLEATAAREREAREARREISLEPRRGRGAFQAKGTTDAKVGRTERLNLQNRPGPAGEASGEATQRGQRRVRGAGLCSVAPATGRKTPEGTVSRGPKKGEGR